MTIFPPVTSGTVSYGAVLYWVWLSVWSVRAPPPTERVDVNRSSRDARDDLETLERISLPGLIITSAGVLVINFTIKLRPRLAF